MRFTITAAVLAFTSSVLAQTPGFDPISKPGKDEEVAAGSTYLVDWEASSNYTGTVTIDLLGGADPGHLAPLSVLAKGVDNAVGEYSWAVDKSLGKLKTYGIRITLDSDTSVFQYSFPFAIKASSDTSSSSSGSGSESSTTAPSTTSTEMSTTETMTTMTTPITTSAFTGNISTTGAPTKSVVTLTTTSSKTSTSATTVPSNPAVAVGASSMALFGGLAMAIFAL